MPAETRLSFRLVFADGLFRAYVAYSVTLENDNN